MSALCGVTGCYIEVTHFHHTSAGIPNMIGAWVKAATSGVGAVLHERQLYVYPRGPGDAPGNQWVCSCGRIWPCVLITHDAQDSIAAAKAHPAAHSNAEWGTLAPPWPCHDDDGVWYCDAHRTYDCRVCATTLPDAPEQIACSCHSDCACASCVEDAEPTQEQKTGWSMAQQKPRCPYCDGLQAENAALRAEVERLTISQATLIHDDMAEFVEMANKGASALQFVEAELSRERAAHQSIVEQVVAWNHAAFTACGGVRNSRSPIEELLAQHEERGAELDEERVEHNAAIDCGKPDCTEPDNPCWTHALKAERTERIKAEELARGVTLSCEAHRDEVNRRLEAERSENERLGQCLAYERDEYEQYREAHPHSVLTLEKWATKLEEYVGYSSTVTRIVGEMRTRSAPGEP